MQAPSLVTAYAALRPRDGFSHPHQEHMKDTYNLHNEHIASDFWMSREVRTRSSANESCVRVNWQLDICFWHTVAFLLSRRQYIVPYKVKPKTLTSRADMPMNETSLR